MARLEFWYDFPSPYAYLASMRIDALAAAAGVEVIWRPVLLGPLLARRPGNPSPNQNAGDVQARYRRRDVHRLAQAYSLPLVWPASYPRFSLLAARVALLAAGEGWAAPFSRAVFQANFEQDRDIAQPAVIAGILADQGRDADDVIARATAPAHKAALVAEGEWAAARGMFGVPSFLVGDELFWGNDRLEQALRWATATS